MADVHRRVALAASLLAAVALPACEDGPTTHGGDSDGCVGGKCDDAGDADPLAGRDDPIAAALREIAVVPSAEELAEFRDQAGEGVGDAVVLKLDPELVAGAPPGHSAVVRLAMAAGASERCSPDAWGTYMLSDDLVSREIVPRVIITPCEDKASKTDRAYIALSFAAETDDGKVDVSAREIEAFGWSQDHDRFQFYRALPIEGSDEAVWVILNPTEIESEQLGGCQNCHRGPVDVDAATRDSVPMLPVMNELVQPWSHWAAPGFAFEEWGVVDPDLLPSPTSLCRFEDEAETGAPLCCTLEGDTKQGQGSCESASDDDAELRRARQRAESLISQSESFPQIMSQPGFAFYRNRLFGADRFENIARGGMDRVQKQRSRDWDQQPADAQVALGMLRPLFCPEQLNYASEEALSGQINMGVAVDVAMQVLYRKLPGGTSWPWSWTTEPRQALNIGGARDWLDRIVVMPMRGQASVIYEDLLVEKRAYFGPEALLQLHALDWKTPVLSDARCDMFEELVASGPDVAGAANLLEATRNLYAAALAKGPALPEKAQEEGYLLVVDRMTDDVLAQLADDTDVPVVECEGRTTCDTSACDDRGYCVMNFMAFGVRIDAYLGSFNGTVLGTELSGREWMREHRRGRVRRLEAFPSAPALE